MTTAAFDAKQFRRGRYLEGPGGKDRRFVGFDTQLGAGVVTDDPEKLARDVVSTSGDLMQSFGLDLGVPFVSSGLLRNSLEQHKAIAFADQLVTGVQDRVDSTFFICGVAPRFRSPDTCRRQPWAPNKHRQIRVWTGTYVFIPDGPQLSLDERV
ncbi:MAG: hypothetical protein MPJ08_05635 [Nitrosopumilus sp.]|nr:hypothetical protein [Nitrosopumilus sp.]